MFWKYGKIGSRFVIARERSDRGDLPLICHLFRCRVEPPKGGRSEIRPTSQIEFSENSDIFQGTHSEPIHNSIEIDDPVVLENL